VPDRVDQAFLEIPGTVDIEDMTDGMFEMNIVTRLVARAGKAGRSDGMAAEIDEVRLDEDLAL
jgi:hypothetical protein